jgi:hypothetical protein
LRYSSVLQKSLTALLSILMIGLIPACKSESGNVVGFPVTLESGVPEENPAAKPPKINKPVSGDVLIAGGVNTKLKSDAHAEFYDPTTRKFLATGPLNEDRVGIAGIAAGGKVTVISGINGTATLNRLKGTLRVVANVRNDVESYDPLTGLFTLPVLPPNALGGGSAFYTATPLNDGTVLIAGGLDGTYAPTDVAEIFDPNTGTYTAIAGGMNFKRAYHTATKLNDGKVLIVGGTHDNLASTVPPVGDSGAEIYDPGAKTFTKTTGNLPTFESGFGVAAQTATLLPDGKVLIAGGFSNAGFGVTTVNHDGVLYDPASQTPSTQFTHTAGVLTDARAFHTATLLSDNNTILFAGGIGGDSTQAIPVPGGVNGIFGGIVNSAELYNIAAQTFTCIGGTIKIKGVGTACAAAMVNSRAGHSATLFTSGPLAGQVLLAGGIGAKARTRNGAGAPLASAELYNPNSVAKKKFAVTGKMTTARALFASVLLP